jgi:mono/diheme cytochrome c family protein
MGRRIVILAGVLAVTSWGAAGLLAQAGKSTADPVYTTEQAAKGKELFREKCESCHNPEKFSGAEWTRAYVGRALSEVSGSMAEMPMDNPGSLTPEETGALIGYFLSMNKYPAGPTALSGETDALKAIMVAPRPQ